MPYLNASNKSVMQYCVCLRVTQCALQRAGCMHCLAARAQRGRCIDALGCPRRPGLTCSPKDTLTITLHLAHQTTARPSNDKCAFVICFTFYLRFAGEICQRRYGTQSFICFLSPENIRKGYLLSFHFCCTKY